MSLINSMFHFDGEEKAKKEKGNQENCFTKKKKIVQYLFYKTCVQFSLQFLVDKKGSKN